MSEPVQLALITSLGTVIVTFIVRWLLFRVTLSGKFAIGADEELKAFRAELRSEINRLTSKVEMLAEQNRDLRVEREVQINEIKDLQEAKALSNKRISELEAENSELKRKIALLEATINGPAR